MEKEGIKFCHEPSEAYLKRLDECGEDPKSLEGFYALQKSGSIAERGWQPTWEARDVRK